MEERSSDRINIPGRREDWLALVLKEHESVETSESIEEEADELDRGIF